MEYKELTCEEHGGTFQVERKRGRPPRNCNPENVCTMARRKKSAQAVGKLTGERLAAATRKVAGLPPTKKPKPTLRGVQRSALNTGSWCKCDEQGGAKHERGIEGCKYATRGAPTVVRNNPSVPIARTLKEQLEPLGWVCHAKGYFSTDGGCVDFSATRDTEQITVSIVDGKAENQHYSIWNDERPALNNKPKSTLGFDPDEMPDAELIRSLAGRKVCWWNAMGKIREYARMPDTDKKKISVQHSITLDEGVPDELPGSRIITFVDQDGTGFRSFKVGALMAVKG